MSIVLSFLLTIVSPCFGIINDDSRQLASLAEKWNITGPMYFNYSGMEFSFTYQVSDFILEGMIAEQLYDENCAEGGIAIPTNDLTSIVTLLDSTTVPSSSGGTGDAFREIQVKLTIDPDTISQSSVYSEEVMGDEMIATVRFCHRFMLFTSSSETPIEVNFRETLITLTIDLTDGFSIGALEVTDKDKLIRTANQAYQVEGYQCDYTNQPLSQLDLALSRNQGSIIRVCVRPDTEARDSGIFMRSIDSFVFQRNYGGSIGTVSQMAVENGSPASNLLTELYCDPGDDICVFETILMATFFRLPGSVSGIGLASMQFGDGDIFRRLQGDRSLQEDNGVVAGVAPFDFSMELLPRQRTPTSDSCGSKSLTQIIFGIMISMILL